MINPSLHLSEVAIYLLMVEFIWRVLEWLDVYFMKKSRKFMLISTKETLP